MPDSSEAVGRDRARAALRWIVGILRAQAIPFQVVGGLAVRAYGGTRALADIDFYVPEEGVRRVLPHVAPQVVAGPQHVVTESWDILFVTLDYEGQTIELGASDRVLIFDVTSQQWRQEHVDFDRGVMLSVLGEVVPVMPLASLLEYKRRLGRPVDLQDIAELRRHAAGGSARDSDQRSTDV